MKIELVLDAKATIGESLLWVADEAALYWADIKAPSLHRFRPSDRTTQSWALPGDLGAFALFGDGTALVALRDGLFRLDLATNALARLAAAPFNSRLIRFNEGACDAKGRFWVGAMTDPLDGVAADVAGALYRFTTEDGLSVHPDFAFITNGMAWNADESVFYLSHSRERVIYAYPYDADQGRLGAARIFARLADEKGIPDGAAVDVAGGYWCAVHGAGRLHRYTRDGVLDIAIELPVSQPTMCCFGGAALDELYVSSAREKLDDAALRREPAAGGIFRLRPGIAGLRRPWRAV